MIGNNSCGTHSLLAGKTVDNVEELHVLLYDGTELTVGPTSDAELDAIVAAGGRRARDLRRAASDRGDSYADRDPRAAFRDIPAPRLRLQPRRAAARERLQRRARAGRHRRHLRDRARSEGAR